MRLDTKIEEKDIIPRLCLYGRQKTKKTWWIGKAAESSFNVVLLDGDDGWHILKNINPEYHKRIQVVECKDEFRSACFSDFVCRSLKSGTISWNTKTKAIDLNVSPDLIRLDFNKLTKHDVLVIDSWTALVQSLVIRYALDHKIDLTATAEDDDKWEIYRVNGKIATWVLSKIKSLKCIVVVIGHEVTYEKMSKGDKRTNKRPELEFSRVQLMSTSNPNAEGIGRYFSDILYFSFDKQGNVKVSTKGNFEQEGGSRFIAPDVFDWDKFTFQDYAEAAGLSIPDESNPLLDFSVKPLVSKQAKEETKTKNVEAKPLSVEKAAPTIKIKI